MNIRLICTKSLFFAYSTTLFLYAGSLVCQAPKQEITEAAKEKFVQGLRTLIAEKNLAGFKERIVAGRLMLSKLGSVYTAIYEELMAQIAEDPIFYTMLVNLEMVPHPDFIRLPKETITVIERLMQAIADGDEDEVRDILGQYPIPLEALANTQSISLPELIKNLLKLTKTAQKLFAQHNPGKKNPYNTRVSAYENMEEIFTVYQKSPAQRDLDALIAATIGQVTTELCIRLPGLMLAKVKFALRNRDLAQLEQAAHSCPNLLEELLKKQGRELLQETETAFLAAIVKKNIAEALDYYRLLVFINLIPALQETKHTHKKYVSTLYKNLGKDSLEEISRRYLAPFAHLPLHLIRNVLGTPIFDVLQTIQGYLDHLQRIAPNDTFLREQYTRWHELLKLFAAYQQTHPQVQLEDWLVELEVQQKEAQREKAATPAPAGRFGIPADWKEEVEGRARVFTSPDCEDTSIRIMGADPASRYPEQREEYVRIRIAGQDVDTEGKKVGRKTPEAHIPLKRFNFNEKIFATCKKALRAKSAPPGMEEKKEAKPVPPTPPPQTEPIPPLKKLVTPPSPAGPSTQASPVQPEVKSPSPVIPVTMGQWLRQLLVAVDEAHLEQVRTLLHQEYLSPWPALGPALIRRHQVAARTRLAQARTEILAEHAHAILQEIEKFAAYLERREQLMAEQQARQEAEEAQARKEAEKIKPRPFLTPPAPSAFRPAHRRTSSAPEPATPRGEDDELSKIFPKRLSFGKESPGGN